MKDQIIQYYPKENCCAGKIITLSRLPAEVEEKNAVPSVLPPQALAKPVCGVDKPWNCLPK